MGREREWTLKGIGQYERLYEMMQRETEQKKLGWEKIFFKTGASEKEWKKGWGREKERDERGEDGRKEQGRKDRQVCRIQGGVRRKKEKRTEQNDMRKGIEKDCKRRKKEGRGQDLNESERKKV